MLSLNNSHDIIANTISLIHNGQINNIVDLINSANVDIPTLVNQLINDSTFTTYLNSSLINNYVLTTDFITTTDSLSDNLEITRTFLTLTNNKIFSTTASIDALVSGKVNNETLNNYILTTDFLATTDLLSNNLSITRQLLTQTKGQIDLKENAFTAISPIQKGFDLSDLNNPSFTLGLTQSFINTVNGKQQNNFYSGFYGNADEETDTTKYRHTITNSSVIFGTPVTCQYDLKCSTLDADAIYGGAVNQINTAIDNKIQVVILDYQQQIQALEARITALEPPIILRFNGSSNLGSGSIFLDLADNTSGLTMAETNIISSKFLTTAGFKFSFACKFNLTQSTTYGRLFEIGEVSDVANNFILSITPDFRLLTGLRQTSTVVHPNSPFNTNTNYYILFTYDESINTYTIKVCTDFAGTNVFYNTTGIQNKPWGFKGRSIWSIGRALGSSNEFITGSVQQITISNSIILWNVAF
jgi:hypothetical protein